MATSPTRRVFKRPKLFPPAKTAGPGTRRKLPARALLAAGMLAWGTAPVAARSPVKTGHGSHGGSSAHARHHGADQPRPAGSRTGKHASRASQAPRATALRDIPRFRPAIADRAGPVRASFTLDPASSALAGRLTALAPQASPRVVSMALAARTCAIRRGLVADAGTRLGVIDYSRPSTVTRLWVFDTANTEHPRLMFSEVVAHGRGSGEILPVSFSNREGSYQSSLGLYTTAETYEGGNGYSLRLDGLEPGFNDQARNRAIVMHGAWYAEPDMIARQGRLGRSQGCPAVRPAVARPLINSMAEGQMLFVYSPDPEWLARSALINCDSVPVKNAQTAALRSLALPAVARAQTSARRVLSGFRRTAMVAETVRNAVRKTRSGWRHG